MTKATTDSIEGSDWPLFGWSDDIRPDLAKALAGNRPVALATLYRVEGSAPRGPGAQMLFAKSSGGVRANGYFSGDCIEGDVARHAMEVLADGKPRRLHYGQGSPWIDIRMRCGGALYILLERITPGSAAAQELLRCTDARQICVWSSDGAAQMAHGQEGHEEDIPLLHYLEDPLHIRRRYDPPRRLIVSGGDPGALALAQLGAQARFETILIRPDGPETPPPLSDIRYLRDEPATALRELGLDRWTAFVGATHEDHHDLAACLHALRHGAGYVGLIGAKARAPGRIVALKAAGANAKDIALLHLSPGIAGLGKSPWEMATGIMAEVMQALNPDRERA